MKKTTIASILLIPLLFGCNSKSISSQQTDNPEIVVEKLFTKDGCTVYRFLDGRRVYYVTCNSSEQPQIANWSESCGKNCVRDIQVTTTTKKD